MTVSYLYPGTLYRAGTGDTLLVCTQGHTLWYPSGRAWACSKYIHDNTRCLASTSLPTPDQQAAYLLGGYEAVMEMHRGGG